MHPYYDTGWSRNIVYPNMGFDETHFIDDFDQTKILRDYITDQELYEKSLTVMRVKIQRGFVHYEYFHAESRRLYGEI